MSKTLKDFEPLIHEWAEKRGIYAAGNKLAQFAKLVEEFGELQDARNKGDKTKVIDGIGDCIVVLINLTKMCGDCLSSHEHFFSVFIPADHVIAERQYAAALGSISRAVVKNECDSVIAHFCDIFYNDVKQIALCHDLDQIECLEFAYNEISGRGGKTVDGVFIKE